MRLAEELLVLGLVLIVVVPVVPALAAEDPRGPTAGPILKVGSHGQMETRNVLAELASLDPYSMAVLARVYDTAGLLDPVTDAILPHIIRGVDGNNDTAFSAVERGIMTKGPCQPAPCSPAQELAWRRTVIAYYDFNGVYFHDGVQMTVGDVFFSYVIESLNPYFNTKLRVLWDDPNASSLPTNRHLNVYLQWCNPADVQWEGASALPGDNTLRCGVRYQLQDDYARFYPETLAGLVLLPRHIYEGTGGGRHADWGLAIYPESDPRFGQGVPTGEMTYIPLDYTSIETWSMTDADVVGSGRFRFNSWVFGVSALLDANANYVSGPPNYGGIRFTIYRTTQLLVLALENGDIDFIFDTLPPEFVPGLLGTPNIGLVVTPALFPKALSFNMRRVPFGYSTYPPPPGQDREPPGGVDLGFVFRQAFSHLIDKTTIVQTLMQNYSMIANGVVSPANSRWYNESLPANNYNPGLAAAMLDNAGWTVGPNSWRVFPRLGDTQFKILTPQADFDPIIASSGAMIAAAAQSIRVNVISAPTAQGAILNSVAARDFDIVLGPSDFRSLDPWSLSRGDPDYLFDLFHRSNAAAGWNGGGFYDAASDAGTLASREALDFASRNRTVQDEQGLLADRSPAIPLYYQDQILAFRNDTFAGWQLVGDTLFNYWSLQGLSAPSNPGPVITLNSPPDGAVVRSGTLVDLSVTDTDLVSVRYTVDGGLPRSLVAPYDVPTNLWADGDHALNVTAQDSTGNVTSALYQFTIDSMPPAIDLVSPANNSIVPAGTVLDFLVADPHLASVVLQVDSGTPAVFPAPYDRSVAGLPDGPHSFLIRAGDTASNVAVRSFSITLDSTPPDIVLESPANNSLVPGRRTLDFRITDLHLADTEIAVDSAAPVAFPAPHEFSLLSLADGPHSFVVRASDAAGNVASRTYSITLDATPPWLTSAEPRWNLTSPFRWITATFSEPVNRTAVEAGFSLTDGTTTWRAGNGTFHWSADGTTFTFVPDSPLAEGRAYEVRLAGTLTDVAGNQMGTDYTWAFAIPAGTPVLIWALGVLLAVVLVAVLLLLLLRRRRKDRKAAESGPPETPKP